jgi:large repetitive protein
MIRSKLSRSAVSAAIGTAVAVAMSTAAFTPVFADTPAPAVTWMGQIAEGASFVYGTVPAAPTCAADPVDPAVTCVVLGYSDQVGTWTLTPQLQDAVTAAPLEVQPTQTITYTVTAWELKGFYAPVKHDKLTRKAGSTVPFTFKVWYDAARTHKAKTATVVASFLAQPVSCTDPTVATGAAVPVASAHKGFTLKYRDGAFHQNWKSPKLPKAAKVKGKKVPVTACYQVTMTTQDGSSISALVTLK